MSIVDNSIYRKSLSHVINAVPVDNSSFLITGASGLIGSCITDVIMLSNEVYGKHNHVYVMGRSRDKLEKRFNSYLSCSCFHILEQDICDPINDDYEFDFIINGASNADPISYARYPVETMTANFIGSYNILEYGRKHLHCKITVLSTFEVYGSDSSNDECAETNVGFIDFNLSRSCYPESKRAAELLSRCYAEEHNVKVNIARLSSVYGPTMTQCDSKAHAQFLRNALRGEEIILKSKGLQKRSYTYLIDAVTGILCILFKGVIKESYNVSNECSIITIAELANLIADLSGTTVSYSLPSEIETKGFSKAQNCILNNTKLKLLGWEGRYSIIDGLEECLAILGQESLR